MRAGRVAVLAAAGMALAGCGGGATAGPAVTVPVTTVPPTTVPPTTVRPTTVPPTTVPPATAGYVPSAPAPSAAAAAAALLAAWGRHDRVAAASVATPAAVGALFAVAPTALQPRGCSDGTPPVTCTYADRSSAAGALYQLDAAPSGAGWYVVDVQVDA